ncbi:MAG: hypothetical protein HQL78_07400 [Magnetococcales bacterium]|nr:hypothetical protein [Magnetococcales bacterium]MBF0419975.1 hypothetical protein [Magnetococcales bacterium]
MSDLLITPGRLAMQSVTLVVTQSTLGEGDLLRLAPSLAKLDKVHLFFVHRGVGLVGNDFSCFPEGRRVYCAFDHARFSGPASSIQAGGLAVLGHLLHETDGVVTLPHGRVGAPKPLAVCLDAEPELALEGLRLAVGLRGCDHDVTLLADNPGSWRTLVDLVGLHPEAKGYVDAWNALGGTAVDHPLMGMNAHVRGAVLRL